MEQFLLTKQIQNYKSGDDSRYRGNEECVHDEEGEEENSDMASMNTCGPCPVFASYTLAFALKMRKKHGKTSVRVAGEMRIG